MFKSEAEEELRGLVCHTHTHTNTHTHTTLVRATCHSLEEGGAAPLSGVCCSASSIAVSINAQNAGTSISTHTWTFLGASGRLFHVSHTYERRGTKVQGEPVNRKSFLE